jgi:hypothetical protein
VIVTGEPGTAGILGGLFTVGGRAVSLRHEQLTPEELALQRDLDRSWEGAQKALADPELKAYLERSITRLNGVRSGATMTTDEFLALTELPPE